MKFDSRVIALLIILPFFALIYDEFYKRDLSSDFPTKRKSHLLLICIKTKNVFSAKAKTSLAS